MIEITIPDPNDLAALVALKREVHALHVAQAGWYFLAAEDEVLAASLRSRLADDKCRALVARRRGQVIGYLLASVRERPATPISRAYRAIYLDEICVAQAERKTGAGRLLVETLLANARAEGFERVELDTWAFNPAAAGFFAKLGFEPYLHKFSLTL